MDALARFAVLFYSKVFAAILPHRADVRKWTVNCPWYCLLQPAPVVTSPSRARCANGAMQRCKT
jgi:hypothetical protein